MKRERDARTARIFISPAQSFQLVTIKSETRTESKSSSQRGRRKWGGEGGGRALGRRVWGGGSGEES